MDEAYGKDTALTALENLRQRLLDLTARNRLIHFRHTKGTTLRVIDELPDELAEMLLTEKELRFLSIPEPTREQLIEAGYIAIDEGTGQEIPLKKNPTAEEWARWLGRNTSYEMPISSSSEPMSQHVDNAIQTLLFPHELEARLRNLRQKAESAIEEMGTNILYLAFGFLEWLDSSDSDSSRLAPLFLVPARLHKGRLNPGTQTYEYTLSYSGEDIIPNLSMREKLRVDFALALPALDEQTRPEAYFESVQDLIRTNQPRWILRRYITLTLLNFSKLLMYLDLDPSRWPENKPITDHAIVSRILAGYDSDDEAGEREPALDFGEEYLIDDLDHVHDKYPLIDDADSSQHSALVDAVDGKNLVIEGPPGTGKSQTITNLIAASIAQGKKVLFVAEKLAALEVVKRRLDAAGLGEFILELHSHKTQKRKALDEVNERIQKRGHYRKPKEIEADIERFEELKEKLRNHVERINRPWKQTGKTLHDIFMAAPRYREALGINPEILHPEGCDGSTFDATRQRRAHDQAVLFVEAYGEVARQLDGECSLQQHPWFGARNTDLQLFDMDRVTTALEAWQVSLEALKAMRPELAASLWCDPCELHETLTGLDGVLHDLERLPTLKGDEILGSLPALQGEVLDEAHHYLAIFEHIQTHYLALSEQVGFDVLDALGSVDRFQSAIERLQQLVEGTVDIGVLARTMQRLSRLQDQFSQIQAPISQIQAEMSEEARKHLSMTESGLQEFKVFVNMVASLRPAYWRLRHDRFDNDELDQVLPAVRNELQALYNLKRDLEGTYHLDGLPDQSTLERMKATLEAGGTFRWLNGHWRSARKRLLGHATSTRVKFKTMMSLLAKASRFAGARQLFNENTTYRELLGEHARGLETPLPSLEDVRQWYRQVRQTYGVGFGPKVSLGNAIINLPDQLARHIRSLAERGIDSQLDKMLSELSVLKTVFVPVADLQNGKALLAGESGLITRLLNTLDEALRHCEPLIADATLTVAELASRIEALGALKQDITRWAMSDVDHRLFQGQLGLQIGLGIDNAAALAKAQHTLDVAACLTQEPATPFVSRRVYDQPDAAVFEELRAMAVRLRAVTDGQLEKYATFEALVSLDFEAWRHDCGDAITGLVERNARALSFPQALHEWLHYVQIRDQLAAMGFDRLANAVERGDVHINQVEDAYYAGVYDVLAREILREEPELSRFSGYTQEALRRQFKDYDNRLKKLQCERIAWQVDQNKVPRGIFRGRVREYTEYTLLQHECGKKTRHISLRQLLRRASGALVALKPCFMMGPMSVAQYLSPGQIDFDMVVMDEASQIKPEDALSAVARGAQLIVVGDPKQLPPSRFFDRVVNDDEEDLTAIEESESILDATLPMFPTRRLRWHYRSQHESLIAFSNHSFYDSDLVLFPSPNKDSKDYGVHYSRVARGCFVNRRNLEEARMISEAVRTHFRHYPEETLGVVAMSAEQRDQIEQAIDMLAKKEPDFRVWLETGDQRQEPLFIKNLENVQGDERDVIFVSLTYGPQEPGGNVLQRFGPINTDMGWRRLNVLFTRSRKRMHVFSSMGSGDIVVGANAKRGVKALRDFLAYGETGILHHTEADTGRAPDSDFEIAVADALQKEGFQCAPQVGTAGFFIDIAVVDPGNPGKYLMGIECDGATYHSAKSVRDRDRLRQAILERLGWRIRRIWSTDWFKQPQTELQPIIHELHDLKTEPCEEPIAEPAANLPEVEDRSVQVEDQETVIGQFVAGERSLKEKLIEFDRKIIRKELPDTPDHQRLLRPAMLDAFLEHLPVSQSEFLELIPPYLRLATNSAEGKFLNAVLEIINSGVDEGFAL